MKLKLFSKLLIVVLFSGICLTGVYLHSEKWNSMIDGISFIATDYFVYETERFEILRMVNLIVIPTLSLLFLLLPFKWSNWILIALMCVYCLMILPMNYIKDPTTSF